MAPDVAELGGQFDLHEFAQAGVLHDVHAPPANAGRVEGIGHFDADKSHAVRRTQLPAALITCVGLATGRARKLATGVEGLLAELDEIHHIKNPVSRVVVGDLPRRWGFLRRRGNHYLLVRHSGPTVNDGRVLRGAPLHHFPCPPVRVVLQYHDVPFAIGFEGPVLRATGQRPAQDVVQEHGRHAGLFLHSTQARDIGTVGGVGSLKSIQRPGRAGGGRAALSLELAAARGDFREVARRRDSQPDGCPTRSGVGPAPPQCQRRVPGRRQGSELSETLSHD